MGSLEVFADLFGAFSAFFDVFGSLGGGGEAGADGGFEFLS
ncbi:hypothetical protein [Hoyosella rhizosphaerae]|uniref:Uncharacterized protein n=1 Tax=Hoyosella rhizosphaerae TaxID=1755582 RepID=A0A916TYU4_9ACTN|nr:hypothetical protein [Hoyosella rhizosphaerae]GGC52987.1 hypothetical protein GCM10011410_01640 [Hoyosella rhizosphaerae]